MKQKRALIIVLLTVVTVLGFAAPVAEERPAIPIASKALVVGPETRLIKDPPLLRWGRQIAIANEAGYSIVSFDLYNQAMVAESGAAANVLKESLGNGERQVIDLYAHPHILSAIASRDGQPFFYTAVDSEGDYYYGEWDPAFDSWTITLTFSSYRSDYLSLRYPAESGSLALINRSGSDLVSFFLEPNHYSLFDGSEENLIEGVIVEPGQVALIPFSSFSESDGWYMAIDGDGNRYRGTFSSDESPWAIVVGGESDRPAARGYYSLVIENRLDAAIWYLWAMDSDEYLNDEWGEELMGWDIIMEGGSAEIDLYGNEVWASRLESGWEGRLYLVAESSDGDRYFSYTEVDSSYPDMVVTIFEQHKMVEESPDILAELVLYNRTGGVLWYLYTVTGLDFEAIDSGEDLLGDLVWQHDQFLTLSLDEDDLDASGIVRLYAVDPDGEVYARSWSEGGERMIIFRQGDRVE